MNWNPEMLVVPDVAMWRLVLGFALAFPLMAIASSLLMVSALVSCRFAEDFVQKRIGTAGPWRRVYLTFVAGPVMAIIYQVLMVMVILSAFATSGRR